MSKFGERMRRVRGKKQSRRNDGFNWRREKTGWDKDDLGGERRRRKRRRKGRPGDGHSGWSYPANASLGRRGVVFDCERSNVVPGRLKCEGLNGDRDRCQ